MQLHVYILFKSKFLTVLPLCIIRINIITSQEKNIADKLLLQYVQQISICLTLISMKEFIDITKQLNNILDNIANKNLNVE